MGQIKPQLLLDYYLNLPLLAAQIGIRNKRHFQRQRDIFLKSRQHRRIYPTSADNQRDIPKIRDGRNWFVKIRPIFGYPSFIVPCGIPSTTSDRPDF